MTFAQTWRSAREEAETGELTYRLWGDYERHHVEHGWWVHPRDWGLGIVVSWAPEYGRLLDVSVDIGPLAWHVALLRGEELVKRVSGHG